MANLYLPPAVRQDPVIAAANALSPVDHAPATAVYDRGRRGNPLPGCDCVQCFGYCMIDGDARERLMFAYSDEHNKAQEDE